MATFFKSSTVWVIDFHHDGRPRRWLKAWPDTDDASADPMARTQALLQDLYGHHATLLGVRRATEQEDADYRQGRLPRNAYCPSGREPLSEPRPPGAPQDASAGACAPEK